MKSKLELADGFSLAVLGNPTIKMDSETLAQIVSNAWVYADKMQAEADKRVVSGVPESIKNSTTPYDIPPKGFTYKFHSVTDMPQEEFQPDWSQAPDDANWWAKDEINLCHWYRTKPYVAHNGNEWIGGGYDDNMLAPNFEYHDHWRESLRKRP